MYMIGYTSIWLPCIMLRKYQIEISARLKTLVLIYQNAWKSNLSIRIYSLPVIHSFNDKTAG